MTAIFTATLRRSEITEYSDYIRGLNSSFNDDQQKKY
jgi:hypothetical protein